MAAQSALGDPQLMTRRRITTTAREASLILDETFAAVDAGIVGRVDWIDVAGERRLSESA